MLRRDDVFFYTKVKISHLVPLDGIFSFSRIHLGMSIHTLFYRGSQKNRSNEIIIEVDMYLI